MKISFHTIARGKERTYLILSSLAYIICLHFVYIYYLSTELTNFGFLYQPQAPAYVVLAWILSLAPAFWMPLHLTRSSHLAYWILYIVVLIPSILIPVYVGTMIPRETLTLIVTMFAGFAIVGLNYQFPLFRIHNRVLYPKTFMKVIFGFFLVCATWMFYVYHNTLNIVAFNAVYDVRFAADDLMQSSYVNYAGMLLSGAIDPFLMAWGLCCKRPMLFAAGALGQLLVYASWSTKGSLTSILFVGTFYLLMRGNRRRFGVKLTVSLVILFSALFGMYIAQSGGDLILSFIMFLVFGRTFTIQGLLTAQYYDFFQHNPVTHYATVNGISLFVPNPYSRAIGIEVGNAVSGDPMYDAIAHFWASDGIAAWGLPGVLLISILCAFVFWVLDSAAQRHDPRFGALVICYAAYNLANIPLFTSLFSGGLGALALWLYLMPPQSSAADPLYSTSGYSSIMPRSFSVMPQQRPATEDI
jgi:hypothetical protein